MKIASLLASNTEIAYALGLENHIVGVSHECDYPHQVNQKPVLTRSKIDPSKSSREIDQQVKTLLKSALSVYEVDETKLRELKPDVILTQDQCEVCAVSLKDVEEAVNKFICQAKIVSLKPETFDDILKTIEIIGYETKKEKEA
ncbi:MAG: cobalamin-binding protein, partial [Deltaproteobacteria bacterium]|nr:cobalamin-binding protein [Deltaproteobacteria bacterium]